MKEKIRQYWEEHPGSSDRRSPDNLPKLSRKWFECMEELRYQEEPFIHSVAQFTRYKGKKILEVGVGTGADFLQWARAGADCYGVDISNAAVEITKKRLALYGFRNCSIQSADAEELPFQEESFDVVYSWGVIHHTEHPENVVAEVRRVLKPSGIFIGMMYNRHSVTAFKRWVQYALLKGKPWRSFANVIWHHVESVGTKAYTVREIRKLFSEFSNFNARPLITQSDLNYWPSCLSKFFPDSWGWFITFKAVK